MQTHSMCGKWQQCRSQRMEIEWRKHVMSEKPLSIGHIPLHLLCIWMASHSHSDRLHDIHCIIDIDIDNVNDVNCECVANNHVNRIAIARYVYLFDNWLSRCGGRRWNGNALTSQLVIKFNDPKRVIQFGCCQCHGALHATPNPKSKNTHFFFGVAVEVPGFQLFRFSDSSHFKTEREIFSWERANARTSRPQDNENAILSGILIKINKHANTTSAAVNATAEWLLAAGCLGVIYHLICIISYYKNFIERIHYFISTAAACYASSMTPLSLPMPLYVALGVEHVLAECKCVCVSFALRIDKFMLKRVRCISHSWRV